MKFLLPRYAEYCLLDKLAVCFSRREGPGPRACILQTEMEEFGAVRDTILKGIVRGESGLAILEGNHLIWSKIFYYLKLHYYQHHVDKTSIPCLLPRDL